MKQCTKCKQLKDESEFSKSRSRKDGLRLWCKSCECYYSKKYYQEHRKATKTYRTYQECHRVAGGVREKLCKNCGRWKAEDQFYKSRRSKDRLQWWCKQCTDLRASKLRQIKKAHRK